MPFPKIIPRDANLSKTQNYHPSQRKSSRFWAKRYENTQYAISAVYRTFIKISLDFKPFYVIIHQTNGFRITINRQYRRSVVFWRNQSERGVPNVEVEAKRSRSKAEIRRLLAELRRLLAESVRLMAEQMNNLTKLSKLTS